MIQWISPLVLFLLLPILKASNYIGSISAFLSIKILLFNYSLILPITIYKAFFFNHFALSIHLHYYYIIFYKFVDLGIMPFFILFLISILVRSINMMSQWKNLISYFWKNSLNINFLFWCLCPKVILWSLYFNQNSIAFSSNIYINFFEFEL